MRNLKRALSLALAAVMVLGMMVIGAGAADAYDNFTDKDEIVNKEAVNTMVSLGVIAGKEDGSYFDPTGIVTRAEMAKIVAVSLNGGKDPVMGSDAKTTFSDTQGHWAELYIAYCVQQNIIAGMGGNRFGPDLPVTGSAAAKMFLCALGYRADLEGLTGSNWEINTNVKANQDAGLYEGLSAINASDGLSRDNTAQMLYNAVQAQEVKYNNLYGEYTGVLQTVEQGTMLWNRFNVVKVTGILEANDKLSVAGAISTTSGTTTTVLGHDFGATARENESLLYVTDVSGYDRDSHARLYGAATYKIDTTDEMVGQEIVIYVRYLNDLSPNAANSTVVGQPILTDNNTVVETTTRLKDAAAVRTALRNGGLSNIGTPAAFLYTEKDVDNGVNTGITDEITEKVRDTDNKSRSAGIFQRFVDNDGDGYPNYIVQIVPVLSSVNSVSSSNDTFTFTGITGSIPDADIVTELELARNEVILINQYADGKYYIDAPETVEGAVASYNTNNNTVSVDGTSYANSGGRMLAVSGTQQILSQEMVDNTYIFYLDPYGNVLGALETDTVVGNYAVVTGYSVSGNDRMGYTGRVRLILQDGTTGTYDVNMAATAVRFGLAASNLSNLAKEKTLVDATYDHDNDPSTPAVCGYFGNPGVNTNGTLLVDHVFSYTLDEGTVTLARPYHLNQRYTSNRVVNNALVTDAELNNAVTALQRNTASYNLKDGRAIVANAQTVFFVKDNNNNYYVVNGLANLPAEGVDIAAITGTTVVGRDTIAYTTPGSTTRMARALFITTDGVFKSARDYVFVTNRYTHSTASGTPIYTFDVVHADGSVEKMSTTDSNNELENTVREYYKDGTYFEFEAPAGSNLYTHDNVYVKSISGNTVTLHDVDTDAYVGSYRVDGSARIWDVQDDEPASDTLSENDIVGIKLDLDSGAGVIEAAYIYDVMNGAFAPAPANANVTIGDAAPGSALTTTAGSNVTVSVTVGTDVSLKSLSISHNDGADSSVTMTRVGDTNVYRGTYSIPANASNGDTLAVTLTVSQSGMDDYTKTYGDVTLTIGGGGGGGDTDTNTVNASEVATTAALQAALDAVTDTLTVDAPITYRVGGVSIPAGKTLAITGNYAPGNAVTNAGTLTIGGDFTAGTLDNTGTISVTGAMTAAGAVGGTVTANGLTLSGDTDITGTMNVSDGGNTPTYADVAGNGTLTVSGTLNAADVNSANITAFTVTGRANVDDITNNATLTTVKGGTLVVRSSGDVTSTGLITVENNGVLSAGNLAGGLTVAATGGTVEVGTIADAVTVAGGNVTAGNLSGDLTVTGGVVTTGTVGGDLSVTGAQVETGTVTGSVTLGANADYTAAALKVPTASNASATYTVTGAHGAAVRIDQPGTYVFKAAVTGALTLGHAGVLVVFETSVAATATVLPVSGHTAGAKVQFAVTPSAVIGANAAGSFVAVKGNNTGLTAAQVALNTPYTWDADGVTTSTAGWCASLS